MNIMTAAFSEIEDIGFILKNPRLWNGMQDPFMYQAVLTLIKDGKELDKVEQPLGLRLSLIHIWQ